jgi:predicted PurR-regulated permease PerM
MSKIKININKKIKDALFLLLIVILAVGFALGFGLIVTPTENTNKNTNTTIKEGFIPLLNAFYRPHMRKLERFTNEKYNDMSNKMRRVSKYLYNLF